MAEQAQGKKDSNLSVTAMYTSHTWVHGGVPDADLLATKQAKQVFDVTNLFLRIVGLLNPAPNLPASLLQRHAMFDHVVRESGARQVLEIAAGLSPRGVTFSHDATIAYTEVDLPEMVTQKRELLGRTLRGQAVLSRSNYRIEAADLRETSLTQFVQPEVPVCIVAEGLFMYLDAGHQRTLWRSVFEALGRATGGEFVFDLTPAVEKQKDGFAGRILSRLMKVFTKGQGFEADQRGRNEIASELREIGFASVEFLEPVALKDAWHLPRPEAKTQVLLFHCTTLIADC